ncbi:hypothetical protein [Undibacterium sp. TJN19]|uniref:hypothetical protein n=1 Tax=Undibacterium sp. TJN19 TaxID=3413055 RepID=UPI003BF2E019
MSTTSREQVIPLENSTNQERERSDFDRSWIVGSTPILIKDEYPQEIQYMEVGQEILSRCEKTGKIEYRKVVSISSLEDVPTYLLYYKGHFSDNSNNWDLRSIEAVGSLPLFVVDKGWTALKNLKTNDLVTSFDLTGFAPNSFKVKSFGCSTQTVLGIKETGLFRRVYNLDIGSFHTYFIREESFWISDNVNVLAFNERGNDDLTLPSTTKLKTKIGGFLSDTLIPVKGGDLSELEFIRPGTEVLSRNEITGELSYRKVLRRVLHESMPEYVLSYKYPHARLDIVFITPGQEFLVKGRGWTAAEHINRGDVIETSDGINATVIANKKEEADQRDYFNYYSLEIEGGGCHFVYEGLCARGF